MLVETERDGLVLIDTGLGTRDVAGQTPLRRSFRGPRVTISIEDAAVFWDVCESIARQVLASI